MNVSPVLILLLICLVGISGVFILRGWRLTLARRTAVLLLIALVSITQCHLAYFSPTFQGYVVDHATQRPIEAAVVVAIWNLKGMEGAIVKSLAVAETKTAADGSFEIAAWGPRFNSGLPLGTMAESAPEIIIMSGGYAPLLWRENSKSKVGSILLNYDRLRDRTFALRSESPNAAERVRDAMEVEYKIWHLFDAPNCGWRRIEALLVELHAVGQSVDVDESNGRPFMLSRIPASSCGDPRAIVGEI